MNNFFGNPEFWTAVAFVFFLIILSATHVHRRVVVMLDKRTKRIKNEIDEATFLREEAQGMLVSYRQKRKEMQEENERFLEESRELSHAHMNRMRFRVEEEEKNLELSSERRIQYKKDAMIREMREKIIMDAIALIEEIIKKNKHEKNFHTILNDYTDLSFKRLKSKVASNDN